MNKRGSDIPSIMFTIVILFAIGITIVVVSNLALQIYQGFSTTFDNNPLIASSTANDTLTTIIGFEQSMWDWFFLAIVFGYLLSMVMLAFVTPTNPWFFPIFVIVGTIGLFVGVALSNAWEKFAESPVLSGTIDRFPITDTILNNFYPLFITIMIALVLVMLFGKRFVGDIGGGGVR